MFSKLHKELTFGGEAEPSLASTTRMAVYGWLRTAKERAGLATEIATEPGFGRENTSAKKKNVRTHLQRKNENELEKVIIYLKTQHKPYINNSYAIYTYTHRYIGTQAHS